MPSPVQKIAESILEDARSRSNKQKKLAVASKIFLPRIIITLHKIMETRIIIIPRKIVITVSAPNIFFSSLLDDNSIISDYLHNINSYFSLTTTLSFLFHVNYNIAQFFSLFLKFLLTFF